jgi:CBS domain-containing protein
MFLSEVLGKPVSDALGEKIGTLADLVVTPGAQFPAVTAAVVSLGRGAVQTIQWSQVTITEEGGLRLGFAKDSIKIYQIKDDDLLLKRDVLDKQIVDVHDYRVVRVNDVRLEESESGLFLVGVDTGMRGLLRRLRLEGIADKIARRIKWRPHTHIIAWSDVETFERSEGRIRLRVPIERIAKLHPADIAKIIDELDPAQRQEVFESLDVETAAETLPETDPSVQVSIVESLDEERAADILEEMEPDEAADVLGDLPADRREDILSEMEPEEREDVEELLEYSDETAGGLMTTEFISISPDMTASQVIQHLRKVGPDAETVYYIYVLDSAERLVGVISLRDLIVAPPRKKVESFMVKQVIHVHLGATIQEIAQAMEDYNLLAIPVVDDENRMQGIVTFDDALQKVLPEDWRRRIPKVWSR